MLNSSAKLLGVLLLVALATASTPARAQTQTLPSARRINDQPITNQQLRFAERLDFSARLFAASDPASDNLMQQTPDMAAAKSFGCVQCHTGVHDMHNSTTVNLGCVDCHGGDPMASTKHEAHVHPRLPAAWSSSANPVRSYTLLNQECPEFIRFVNPGDLRVAHLSCGQCHPQETLAVKKSMMTHGCMLWGAALYNNGSYPAKAARFGESYSMCGTPQRIQTVPPPTAEEMYRGVLPYLDPLPRFEVSQPGNVLRIFERGGRFRPEIGIPERLEEPGRPRERLSERGLGTENRTDPVMIGLQKTRLFDPTLNFLGTNDHAGDYRSSGCTACHVVYANDRSPVHSGPYAKYGNRGLSHSADPMIPKNETGHPIEHKFALSMPTSQCIVCHVHPGTNVLNSYLGFMWWDNETDGELMYPKQQKYPTAEEFIQAQMSNPNEAAARGLWSDPEFLANVTELNPQAEHTQFADFQGHGWVYRAVYKKDRKGNLLDHKGDIVENPQTADLMAAMVPPTHQERRLGKQRDCVPVHLMDIHLEKGMHCVDCHFHQDVHGDTKLYGEVRAAIEITCTDCHGTQDVSVLDKISSGQGMRTSGPAARRNENGEVVGTNLLALRTPFGKPGGEPRFQVIGDKIYQRSMVERDMWWELVQTKQTVTPGNPRYNVRSHQAKTVRFGADGVLEWGGDAAEHECAHQNSTMSCIACHTSWNPSCFGCHLPQKSNKKMPSLHNEGDVSRNYVSYNFQTLRDDVFMLARDGNATGNKVNPARSSCAIHVTSYNQNREAIYTQQQTISADGMSGIAFSTNVPHTVRGGSPTADSCNRPGTYETKMCTDCHVSQENDNNAVMAQLLMQGTNYVNFIGQNCWVAAGEHGLEAVTVTEREEPQAVIGSSLHKLAFPDFYKHHLEKDRHLEHAHEHPGIDVSEKILHPFRKTEILTVQARGEFLYAACGEAGVRIFDIAFIDHKGFSERITTAPVSPLGQRLYVDTEYAAAVVAPATIAPDPTRVQFPNNHEGKVHPLYAYIYVADKQEGLILINVGTLLDGNPLNNFIEREVTFNPEGLLCGASNLAIVGEYAYVCCDAGLVVVSLADPTKPVVTAVVGEPVLKKPRAVQAQFRYAFVVDEEGLKVLDITTLHEPIPAAAMGIHDARSLYVARTYAYIAGGEEGLLIIDITNPEQPVLDQIYNAEGCINDLNDVKLGITNVSEFAYLADGHNGLRVVQLTSPALPGNDGYSPRPAPHLVANYKLPKGGHALSISEGIDRDRAVDESGNQIAVFGRIGARPLNREEQWKMYLHQGKLFKVSDNPFNLDVYRAPKALINAPEYRDWIQPQNRRDPPPPLLSPLPFNAPAR